MRKWLLVLAAVTLWTAGWASQPGASPAADGTYQLSRKFIYPAEFERSKSYTPGVLAGNTLYVSGQTDRHRHTGTGPEGIADQTRMAMDNLGHVLRAAGMDYGNVVSCHVQLADVSTYEEMCEVYRSYFGPDHYPARTTIEVPGLPGGANINVTCVAYADKSAIAVVGPPEAGSSAAAAPDPPAVWAGDTLYLSGSSGHNAQAAALQSTVEEDQTKQAMDNIGRVLSAAGLQYTDAVFANVYFLDQDGYKGPTYGKLNSVYRDFFPLGTAPSRASFCVSNLPGTMRVKITCIATRDRANKGRVVPGTGAPSPTSSMGGVFGGHTLYTSGKSGAGATLEEQMRDSLESIRAILKLAGMNLEHVVDAHVYLRDIGQMDAMNAVFQEYFPRHPPARTTVQVIQHQLVQVQVVAVR